MQTYDDRYGYQGSFTLMQCQHCGHEFLDCNLSASELTELYTNYYPRKCLDIANYTPHTEQNGFTAWFNGSGSSAFRWVPRNVRVLDVGCGFGQSLGYHTARGCDVYGVEADENIRRVVEKFGFKVHVGLFDDKVYEQDFFDFVTMDQVIEHVTDPIATLRGVARILKSGGTAILSTPNARGWGSRLFGKRWINWHTPYHLQFFTRESMRQAAEQSGLVLTEVKTVTNSEWLHYQWIHLVTYPKPGKPSWFWSPDKSGARAHQKIMVRLLSLLHRTKINHWVTRLLDGLGLGDNFVFILKKP
ncbi:class I SAM-dependent methyltransferase [Ferrigenium sp. UT5]|uniref:class I SAM-dependent methyltransferase n=1 Tax=Ferrigenium sp. UT5 TaxID=3242105 RepID=UPI0035508965